MTEINQNDFDALINQHPIVAVDFYSTECPPCEALAPKYDALAELYEPHVKFVKVFRQGNRELATQLGIMGSPTVIFFKDGNRVGETLHGGIKRADLVRNLNSLISEEQIKEIESKIKSTESHCDVAILGGGPGGLAAGIYLAQAKLDTLIIDSSLPGGQVSTTHQVSNYPGFIEPQPGYMLAHNMSEQAKANGVRFKSAVDITNVDLFNKTIEVDGNEIIRAKKIILAMGASPRYLNIPGEKELKGKGISYCATCDAKYFQDKEVIVIGGGNTAIEESEFISKFASKITIIHQFDKLNANKEAQEKAFANPKISFLFSCEPRSFEKKEDKMKVVYEDLKTREMKDLSSDGVFVFVGMKPNTELVKEEIEKDQWGYIKTDEDMHTSIDGVFAVGDLISKKYRQITTAVSDGTIASIVISKEIES